MGAYAMALDPGAPVVCRTCDNERVTQVRVAGAPPWAARPCVCPDCPTCANCGELATVVDANREESCTRCAAELVGHVASGAPAEETSDAASIAPATANVHARFPGSARRVG